MSNEYLNLEDLQAVLGAETGAKAESYELAIESASRWIDEHCSDRERNIIRHFWQEPSPTERSYTADTPWQVRTGDFDDPDTVTVEVDLLGDGTWTPLDAATWHPEPLNQINGWPFTRIVSNSYDPLFPLSLQPRVKVTAQWGWAEIPKPVSQACEIVAIATMGGKAVVSMHDGYDVDSTGPTNPWAFAEMILEKYLPPELAVAAMLPKGKLR